MLTLRFFEDKDDVEPVDGYKVQVDMPGCVVFALQNWMKMHPNGKVEVT